MFDTCMFYMFIYLSEIIQDRIINCIFTCKPCFHECLIDVLLESEAAYRAAIEELRKKIDEIVKELNALKEVHALQLGTE